MTKEPSHRKRFAAGLLLGLLVGVGVLYWALHEARVVQTHVREQRDGIVTVLSLATVIEQVGATGDEVRAAVTAIAGDTSKLRRVRVIRGATLEASTFPGDTGEKAPPRRLAIDEKPVYDQGQRLRAAIQTNREENVARKEEIELERIDSDLRFSAPLEQNGSFVGFVQIEKALGETAPKAGIVVPVAAVLIAFALFLAISFWLGERKYLLAIVALLLLGGTLFWYAQSISKTMEADRRATEAAITARIKTQSARIDSILQSLAIQPEQPIKPSTWDADVFRRPLGLIGDDAAINEAKLTGELKSSKADLLRFAAGVGVLSLAILAFLGFGGAAKLINIFVRHRQAYAYTTPAMIGMIVLVFFPFLYGIALSFTDSTLYNTNKPLTEIWIGFRNYVEVLADLNVVKTTEGGTVINYANFYWTFLFTVIWTVTNVAIGVVSGLILALILNTKGLAMRPLYRVLLIFPWATPNYITALIWKGMFHQQFGVINQVLLIFGMDAVSWFQRPSTSFLTALATNGWLSFPFMMVISLGALQSISADLYEAARVDGATKWQQFKSITLPSLRPALVPAIILSVVWTFNMFNIIYLVTGGEPAGSTEILITQAYKIAFEKYRYGYAAAYSTVIFIVLLMYGIFQNRVTRATESIA